MRIERKMYVTIHDDDIKDDELRKLLNPIMPKVHYFQLSLAGTAKGIMNPQSLQTQGKQAKYAGFISLDSSSTCAKKGNS